QLIFNAQAMSAPITGATLTCTQSTTNTSSCVGAGGVYASGWTGAGSKYWEYTVSTLGYTNITFQVTTRSSGTGPKTGQAWVDYGSGCMQIVSATYSLSTS